MDAFDDFDFGESSRPTISLPATPHDDHETPSVFDFARPSFGAGADTSDPGIDDGSSMFGRLSIGSSAPGSPISEDQKPLPPIDFSSNDMGEDPADRATDDKEPMGPSMHPNAHVTDDGFVEAEVDGRKIRVPADDVSFPPHLCSCSQTDHLLENRCYRLSSLTADEVVDLQAFHLITLLLPTTIDRFQQS